jgi:hypothetical protein
MYYLLYLVLIAINLALEKFSFVEIVTLKAHSTIITGEVKVNGKLTLIS